MMPEANVKLFAMARTVSDGEVRGVLDTLHRRHVDGIAPII
jgi:hypothetical protein